MAKEKRKSYRDFSGYVETEKRTIRRKHANIAGVGIGEVDGLEVYVGGVYNAEKGRYEVYVRAGFLHRGSSHKFATVYEENGEITVEMDEKDLRGITIVPGGAE